MALNDTKYSVQVFDLEYRQGTSDKFYRVFISETGCCVLQWGRRGSAGQMSATKYRHYQEAVDVGLRQVYAKKSKGYAATTSDFVFMASDSALTSAMGQSARLLVREYLDAKTNGDFAGHKDAVLKHYEDFADKVKTLMDQAETDEAGDLVDAFDSLERVWSEINDKHAEVEIAMNIAKQTTARKLMGL